MKPKIIAGVALVAFVVLASGVVSYGIYLLYRANQADAISHVINENHRAYEEMLVATKPRPNGILTVHDLMVAVSAMTGKMRSIDVSKCPEDFQQTDLRYRQAWEGLEQKLSQLPQTGGEAIGDLLATALSTKVGLGYGNPIAKAGDEFSKQKDVLRLAWNDLEAEALRYGVTIK